MICKLILVFCLSQCQAIGQHLVCQPFNDVIRPGPMTVSGRSHSSRVGNLVGNRDPEEKTRDPDSPGIDYVRINSTIDEKIQLVSNDPAKLRNTSGIEMQVLRSRMKTVTSGLRNQEKTCKARMRKLSSEIKTAIYDFSKLESSLEAKMQNLKAELIFLIENLHPSINGPSLLLLRKLKGLCDVQYNNSCFWAIVHNSRDVDYTEAERLCNKSGGQVADIYDLQHYNLIMEHLRAIIPSSENWVWIWIATKYNPITDVATARNGSQAFVSWYPGRKFRGTSDSSRTSVVISVQRQEDHNDQGMWNGFPVYPRHGAVCEI